MFMNIAAACFLVVFCGQASLSSLQAWGLTWVGLTSSSFSSSTTFPFKLASFGLVSPHHLLLLHHHLRLLGCNIMLYFVHTANCNRKKTRIWSLLLHWSSDASPDGKGCTVVFLKMFRMMFLKCFSKCISWWGRDALLQTVSQNVSASQVQLPMFSLPKMEIKLAELRCILRCCKSWHVH